MVQNRHGDTHAPLRVKEDYAPISENSQGSVGSADMAPRGAKATAQRISADSHTLAAVSQRPFGHGHVTYAHAYPLT